MKAILFYFSVVILLIFNTIFLAKEPSVSAQKMPSAENNYILQAYLPFWEPGFNPDPKVLSRFTHVALAFAYPQENGEVTFDHSSKSELDLILKNIREAKKINPELKCIWAVGGWSDSKYFAPASSDAHRKFFVENLIKLVDMYDCDGIDIDWEFPKTSERPLYTKLINDLHAEIKRQKKTYQISAAVAGVGGEHTVGLNIKEIIGSLHHLNVMTYDYYGNWSETAGFHTAAFKSSRAFNNDINVNSGVKYYLDNGAPANKIVVGAAFYGKIQSTVSDGKTGDGLGQKTKGIAKVLCHGRQFTDEIPYSCLKQLPSDKWKGFFDDEARSPYLYNTQSNIFISYDDPRSLEAKIDLVKHQRLGGMMLWELTEDLNNELSNVLFSGFEK